MPIYEYQCDSCADKFEIKQGMKDDAITACPRCGKHVQRLISSPAIMFKGSGWYVTDYSDKMKPSPGSELPVPTAGEKGEKKDTAPSTSDQTPSTSTTPSTPVAPPASAPASTPSNTTSSTSSTAPTAPSSSTTKQTAGTGRGQKAEG